MTVQQLVLVAKPGPAREAYLREIQRLGQEVDVFDTLRELHDRMQGKAYHGIFVDLATKVRASSLEKELLHEVLNTAPTATLKFLPDPGEVRSLYHGQTGDTGTVESFWNEQCKGKGARRIRIDLRVVQNLNVILLRAGESAPEAGQRSVTVDISFGGCFVFTAEPWRMGELGRVIFQDLNDRSPVDVEVRWVLPWGRALKVPGVGLGFTDPEQAPVAELRTRFRLRTRHDGDAGDVALGDGDLGAILGAGGVGGAGTGGT